MKKIQIILLILIAATVFASQKGYKKLKKTLRSAAEQVITKKGFTILDPKIQEEALKEQNTDAVEDDCIDDACLMDTGKMLAAQRLFIIRITKLGENQFLFKIIHTNLETNEMLASQSEVYTGKLSNYNDIFYFGQKFFKTIFEGNKSSAFSFAQASGTSGNKEKIPVMIETVVEADSAEDEKKGEKFILSINTNPDGVNIYNGNKIIGISPVTLQLPAGVYNLTFHKKGYDRLERKVELFKNEKIDIKQMYHEGGPYPVTIKTKLPSKLYYKGKLIGETTRTIDLKSGNHKIELENDVAGRKFFNIEVNGVSEKTFAMNYGFKWAKIGLNTEYWNMKFDNQTTSNVFLFGINSSLFIWNWKYFEIDALGGGFSFGLNKMMSWRFHVAGITVKPLKNLTLNLSAGPLLGDFIRIYDNDKNIWLTYAGAKIGYRYNINNLIGIKLYSSFYYGASNSKESSYTNTKETDTDKGFMINLGFGIVIEI